MDILTSFFIATGLSMDVFAVSITSGVTMKNMGVRRIILFAGIFGFFHALMPTLGWLLGWYLQDAMQTLDHWTAFILLTFVGGKMIYEAVYMEEMEQERDISNFWILLLLAIATSIDALAVGFSFSIMKISVIVPVLIIGLVSFAFSFAGVYIGKRYGHLFEKNVEIMGGIILIGIGLKILLEHLGINVW